MRGGGLSARRRAGAAAGAAGRAAGGGRRRRHWVAVIPNVAVAPVAEHRRGVAHAKNVEAAADAAPLAVAKSVWHHTGTHRRQCLHSGHEQVKAGGSGRGRRRRILYHADRHGPIRRGALARTAGRYGMACHGRPCRGPAGRLGLLLRARCKSETGAPRATMHAPSGASTGRMRTWTPRGKTASTATAPGTTRTIRRIRTL